MNRPAITGQLIFTDKGDDDRSGKVGNKLVMVIGILSVPKNSTKDQHQYTVIGSSDGLSTELTVLEPGTDLKDTIRGSTADGILCSPLWRV